MSIFITSESPALVLAPMEGVTDAPMRALLTRRGGFTFCVSEFFRISQDVPSARAFPFHIPELKNGSKTPSGTPVQVQLLGGNPERMAQAAVNACIAGARAIDINFGCPAPLVNRNDGGACLLKEPARIFAIVNAVRRALPSDIPVSAKLRLGWESTEDILRNVSEVEQAGAQWITIHARTKAQGYRPPVYWKKIGEAKRKISIPVVANGDLWSLDDVKQCQKETDCIHFMIGRSALANPNLPMQISNYLSRRDDAVGAFSASPQNWQPLLEEFSDLCNVGSGNPNYAACRIKQWLSLAMTRSPMEWVPLVKKAQGLNEIFSILKAVSIEQSNPNPQISSYRC